MRIPLRALAPALVIGALPWTLGAGCDLFATREPDVSEGTESLWQPPTSPNIVVENLRLALEAGNFTDYRRALTDDFVFLADGTDVAQIELERPGEMTFEGWGRDVEGATAETLRGAVETLRLVLNELDEDIEPGGRLIKYGYTLTLTSAGGAPTTYAGEAWYRVRQEPGGQWFIYEWEDVANSPTFSSWGLLKGRNRL